MIFSDAHEAAIFQFDTLDFLNFKKRIFVLTGFSESKKRELKQLIESKGGEVQESVYQGASYLVVNKFKKLGKARSPKELEEKFEVDKRLQCTS